MKYVLLFIAIQIASALLTLIGLLLIAYLVLSCRFSLMIDSDGRARWHFPRAFRLWDNKEDGVVADWYLAAHPTWSLRRCIFMWSACRNSCNNLRYVRGVSGVGRPLVLRHFQINGKQYYFKAGWLLDGYPALSIGAGRGW